MKWIVARSLLLLGGLAVGLLLLEGGTRVLGPVAPRIPQPAKERAFWVHDTNKGWFHRPQQEGEIFVGSPDRGLMRINALGFRGQEIAPETGRPRVLVLGDSYVFGAGVDEEHLFTTILGRHLRAEVLNAGVHGYSTDQELLLLREVGARLHPDLVLLVICDNDLEGNESSFLYYRYYKPYFEVRGRALVARNLPVPDLSAAQRTKLFVAERSNVWSLLRTRRSRIGWLQDLLEEVQVGKNRHPRSPWRTTVRLVEEIQSESLSLGAQFLAVNAARVEERRDIMEALGRRLRRASVSYADVWDAMTAARATAPAEHWDFVGPDRHWNVGAHRAMAEIVAEEIQRRGLLAERGGHRSRSARVADVVDPRQPQLPPSTAARPRRECAAVAGGRGGLARLGVGRGRPAQASRGHGFRLPTTSRR